MTFRPDQPHLKQERPSQAERFRDSANRLRDLIEFMRAGARWEMIDPDTKAGHQETLGFVKEQKSADPAYEQKSLAQVAEDLILRYDTAVQAAEMESRKKVGDIVRLPGSSRSFEVVRVIPESRSYIVADTRDRRSAEELTAAVWSGEQMTDGKPVGYEVNWDQLDKYAA